MPNATEIRMERIFALIAWAEVNLGSSNNLLYDKILRQARLNWPTLESKTIESYSRAATKGVLIRRLRTSKEVPEPVVVQTPLFYTQGINTLPV